MRRTGRGLLVEDGLLGPGEFEAWRRSHPPIMGAAGPNVVQATGAAATSVAYGSNLTAGNTLLAAVGAAGSAGLTFTVSDGTNGAWTAIAATKYNTTFSSVQWFYFNNTAGGVKPTVTAAGGTANSIIIHEVSGLANPLVTDGANVTEGTSAAPATSVTVGTVGDFVIGYACVANTASVGTGFNAGAADGNGNQTEWVDDASSGPLSVAFTQTSGLYVVSAFAALALVNQVTEFVPQRMPLGV